METDVIIVHSQQHPGSYKLLSPSFSRGYWELHPLLRVLLLPLSADHVSYLAGIVPSLSLHKELWTLSPWMGSVVPYRFGLKLCSTYQPFFGVGAHFPSQSAPRSPLHTGSPAIPLKDVRVSPCQTSTLLKAETGRHTEYVDQHKPPWHGGHYI